MDTRAGTNSQGDRTGLVLGRVFQVFRFEADPCRKILTIVGEVTVTAANRIKKTVEFQKKEEFRKSIQLNNLHVYTENQSVIEEVLGCCPFIDNSMIDQLGATIDELKYRRYDSNELSNYPQHASDGSYLPRHTEMMNDYIVPKNTKIRPNTSDCSKSIPVDIRKLDEYVELLYEDLTAKIQGSGYISELTKLRECLEIVTNHETALNAMIRTLRDDGNKSMQLATNILTSCLHFSEETEFHPLLSKLKILSITLDTVDYQLGSCEQTRLELDLLGKKLEEKTVKTKKHEQYESRKNRFHNLVMKQDELLQVALQVINNLSVDLWQLKELCNEEVIASLVTCLSREHVGLLEIALKFLKNLSVFMECMEMAEKIKLIGAVATLLKSGTPIPRKLVKFAILLLFNLTFESELREYIIKVGLLSSIAKCFSIPELEEISLNILYNLSMDPQNRSKFASTSAVMTMMNAITHRGNHMVSIELGAFAVNLSRSKRCAAIMCKKRGFVQIVGQALTNEDKLLMKVVRNLVEIAMSDRIIPFANDIAEAIITATSNAYMLECIGTLANFNPLLVDFSEVIEKNQLISFISSALKQCLNAYTLPPDPISDAFMQLIILVGTLAGNPECAGKLIEEGIMNLLRPILFEAEAHDDLRVSVIFSFCRLIEHPLTRRHIVDRTEIPQFLLDMLPRVKGQLLELCNNTMDILAKYEKEWRLKLLDKRFIVANKEWVEMYDSDFNFTDQNSLNDSLPEEESYVEEGQCTIDGEASNPDSDYNGVYSRSNSAESMVENEMEDDRSIFDSCKQQYEEEMAANIRKSYFISHQDDELEQLEYDYDYGCTFNS